MKITARAAKRHAIAGKLAKLKKGETCRADGIPYGTIRTTVWRLRAKYPKRIYRCFAIDGGALVIRSR